MEGPAVPGGGLGQRPRIRLVGVAALVALGCPGPAAPPAARARDVSVAAVQGVGNPGLSRAEQLVALSLACIHREYPNQVTHLLRDAEDVASPRRLTPAFYGCFDWHSAVHNHWALVRWLRVFPAAPFAVVAREALADSLTPAHLAVELAYVGRDDRGGFERPYGLAWVLTLAAELRAWDDPIAAEFVRALEPLETLAATRLVGYFSGLPSAVREGQHAQTAFSLGLVLDWTTATRAVELNRRLRRAAERLFGDDRGCRLAVEPSAHDFLSPCLAEADLMRRVLSPTVFARWLRRVLPAIPSNGSSQWLRPVTSPDRSDGKLAHLDGLNLSRAWMLESIAAGLPGTDLRRASLHAAASEHAEAGLAAVTGEHYAGSHWLASFATYLATRGLDGSR